jgi:hypothetical protein
MEMKKQILWLIVSGSLLNATGFLSQRFFETPDFIQGILQGAGVGLLLLALLKERKYRTCGKDESKSTPAQE